MEALRRALTPSPTRLMTRKDAKRIDLQEKEKEKYCSYEK